VRISTIAAAAILTIGVGGAAFAQPVQAPVTEYSRTTTTVQSGNSDAYYIDQAPQRAYDRGMWNSEQSGNVGGD
jgi:hypothetical protein